jgi:hypothetical protein
VKNIIIQYFVDFAGSGQHCYEICLDGDTLERLNPAAVKPANWMRLGFAQCRNCPLDTSRELACPLAVCISDIVGYRTDAQSYDPVDVTVVTPERTISKTTTVQAAISSLMGVVMPTSGCPHLAPLRPMARFHLPFASDTETLYRVSSMYLLAQYFRRQEDRQADFSLDGLKTIYDNLHTVNSDFSKRLRAAVQEDASVNAVVLLDLFAKSVSYNLDNSLNDMRYMFSGYLE